MHIQFHVLDFEWYLVHDAKENKTKSLGDHKRVIWSLIDQFWLNCYYWPQYKKRKRAKKTYKKAKKPKHFGVMDAKREEA